MLKSKDKLKQNIPPNVSGVDLFEIRVNRMSLGSVHHDLLKDLGVQIGPSVVDKFQNLGMIPRLLASKLVPNTMDSATK